MHSEGANAVRQNIHVILNSRILKVRSFPDSRPIMKDQHCQGREGDGSSKEQGFMLSFVGPFILELYCIPGHKSPRVNLDNQCPRMKAQNMEENIC